MVWRELYDKVKDAPSWRERISALAAKRAQAGAEIAALIRKYLDQAITSEALRAPFDQRRAYLSAGRSGAAWNSARCWRSRSAPKSPPPGSRACHTVWMWFAPDCVLSSS